jgi:Sap, sulfolipid-1-addressing protein
VWELIPLALLSAVYPTLLAVVVVALSQPRPARTMAFFLLGGMIASITVGLVVVSVFQGTSVVDSSNSTVNAVVYFGAGAFALLLALVVRRRAPAPHREGSGGGRVTRLLSHSQRAIVAFAVGLIINLAPGAWYVVALKDIAQSSYTQAEVVGVVVAFCIVMYALIELPLLGFVFAPERAADLSQRFSTWLGDNRGAVAVWVLAGGGCYLILRGILSIA